MFHYKLLTISTLFFSAMLFFMSCKNEADKNKTINDENLETKQVKENYGTGEISRTYNRVKGKIEGKMTDYYPSGALKGERFFENNKQIGKTSLYFESGAIKEVQYYANGLKNGGDTVFYEDGKLQFVVALKDEKKDGYLRKWGQDGALIYEAKFEMDTLVEVGGKNVRK